MLPADKVPTSHGSGPSFQDYEEQVRFWMRMTHLDPARRTAALIFRMNSAARQVRMSAGGDHLDSHNGALRISDSSKKFASEAAGSLYREVAHFLLHRSTDQ